ncbi:uncharacterized protein N7529_001611 [Penicillium soppii]|uniref:uncharacterized protein n=1 Tax=Penicillium soppii TaxID=69789 RepID=UPI00254698EF|nr:uncharacterized protein N7529_001611 [Penicillium soppii]KAJ5876027.1 hypothetical protein N7529_001611 [Penicillium soppii]
MVLKRVSLTFISRFGLTQLVGTLDAVDDSFIRIEKLRRLAHRVGDFGLRLPGSDVHDELVDWISDIVHEISGIRVLESQYDLITWKPNQGSSLVQSGDLVAQLNGSYERPYLTTPSEDSIASSQGGATGLINAFGMPRKAMEN